MIFTTEEMDSLYKFLALKLSDRLSSQLKISFDLKDVATSQAPYTEIIKPISSFCYVGLMQYYARGVLLFVDPRIIYMLSNRMLGGQGIIEDKEYAHFTPSEHVFGEQLMNWALDFYKELQIPVTYLRSEENAAHVHYFYPDEVVFGSVMKCRINDKVAGHIIAVHPVMDPSEVTG